MWSGLSSFVISAIVNYAKHLCTGRCYSTILSVYVKLVGWLLELYDRFLPILVDGVKDRKELTKFWEWSGILDTETKDCRLSSDFFLLWMDI